ncbi:uncharacterized protein PODANS_3_1130 [Podospora anserina S mat+]|uniref:Podospora anserina S mat+ genomic DNA chromosome 3, supercontig 1 n=1 Tax=Podospora anserina (strain S / ATCC MYA-4624 / DSM 980 / FGSC 10383) TaxID=515849 RepID=B2ACI7_PODAN|nr:uncharacterized protein PODANS_3_1130 [Podospora anserina S mat+]CAP61152.1 unnamed protein product [Podospora anserina S mat+]CDP26600.1 Putative protein of unknown function [Podospora anserina S mat+]
MAMHDNTNGIKNGAEQAQAPVASRLFDWWAALALEETSGAADVIVARKGLGGHLPLPPTPSPAFCQKHHQSLRPTINTIITSHDRFLFLLVCHLTLQLTTSLCTALLLQHPFLPSITTSQTANTMSYAEVASKGPKQTPEEAAAPQPPQVVVDDSTSTSSLIDVDTPSVRTVPSDFAEQEVKTDTQAARIEREEAEKKARAKAETLRAEADLAKKKAKSKAKKADTWLTKRFENMGDGPAGALAVANLIAVIGLSGWLGFKAWNSYERGRLSWKDVGLGLGLIGAVGAVEGAFTNYLYKAKGKGKEQ